jgi:hypothetical protein
MTWSAKLAPWPSVADAGRAVDFYKSAFGAVEPERLEGDVGVLQVARLLSSHAPLSVGFIVWARTPRLRTRSPAVCRAARTRW